MSWYQIWKINFDIFLHRRKTGFLPPGIPPAELLLPGIPLVELLPKRDSSRNGIPPEMGFLPKREGIFFLGRNTVLGGIPFREESHFGRDPGREEFRGRDPGREEFLGRNPVFLLCRKIQNESFISYTRRWKQAITLSNEFEDFNLCLYLKWFKYIDCLGTPGLTVLIIISIQVLQVCSHILL